jgi:hypothetical protein
MITDAPHPSLFHIREIQQHALRPETPTRPKSKKNSRTRMDGLEILIAPRNSSGSDSSMLIGFENMLSPPSTPFRSY